MEYFSFGSGVLPEIRNAAALHPEAAVFLFADENTDRIAGQTVRGILEEAGRDVQYYVFPAEKDHDLFPDETSLGRILINMRKDTGLLIGVGSGVINDLGKYASLVTGIPHMIVATAPSMDGYVSNSSSITCENRKLSVPTVLPRAVIGDTDILMKAPLPMIQSGFGDMLGKLTALADWKLAQICAGEYYCTTTAQLVRNCLDPILEHVSGIAEREEPAIQYLIQGLVQCGVAMSIVGLSRPASGAEHMLSHYWEMEFHEKGLPIHFHGTKVGLATPIIARLFEKLKEYLPNEVTDIAPSSDFVKTCLTMAGLPVHPEMVGVDRKLFIRTLKEAYTVRKRYSILQFAVEAGKIDRLAEELAEEYYG